MVFWERVMFLLVLVTCVSLEGQTLCHEFEREAVFAERDSCMVAAALERGRYSARIHQRTWTRYYWKCHNSSVEIPDSTASSG